MMEDVQADSHQDASHEDDSLQEEYDIIYLAPAQRDLQRLLDFLTAGDVSLVRAQEIVLKIVKKLRMLKSNPFLGYSIGGKYGFDTPYRGLVCGKYIAVYEVFEPRDGKPGNIEVRRIYHARENYLVQLQNLSER